MRCDFIWPDNVLKINLHLNHITYTVCKRYLSVYGLVVEGVCLLVRDVTSVHILSDLSRQLTSPIWRRVYKLTCFHHSEPLNHCQIISRSGVRF